MNLRSYIDQGIEMKGSLTALADYLDVLRESLSAAKAGRRGLPIYSCGKLADLIGVDRWLVVAASELITEKNEQKRAYLAPFVSGPTSIATTIAVAVVSIFMTTTPAEAAPLRNSTIHAIDIM